MKKGEIFYHFKRKKKQGILCARMVQASCLCVRQRGDGEGMQMNLPVPSKHILVDLLKSFQTLTPPGGLETTTMVNVRVNF